jgi:uncharacterized protein YecE (DUF72 family)
MTAPRPGRALVGTSGFAYRDWAPRFYPPGVRAADLLRAYGERLDAVELNNTFYVKPSPNAIAGWLAATPASFRFCAKAQRGGAWRAMRDDPQESVTRIADSYAPFGDRLRCVLFRVPDDMRRDDGALGRLLDAWPRTLPLAIELRHPSWQDDAVHELLRGHGAVLVATDTDDDPTPPDLRRTGPFLYLRLRRSDYAQADLDAWAARLAPFLDDGMDACVFLRHDADGGMALAAESLRERLDTRARAA